MTTLEISSSLNSHCKLRLADGWHPLVTWIGGLTGVDPEISAGPTILPLIQLIPSLVRLECPVRLRQEPVSLIPKSSQISRFCLIRY